MAYTGGLRFVALAERRGCELRHGWTDDGYQRLLVPRMLWWPEHIFGEKWVIERTTPAYCPDQGLVQKWRGMDLVGRDGERTLIANPAVLDEAVMPHDKLLERPLSCFANKGAATEREIREDTFARWWTPDEVLVSPEIPKTRVGTFDNKALRARYANPASRKPLHAPTGEAQSP
jgi:hypothetical protein